MYTIISDQTGKSKQKIYQNIISVSKTVTVDFIGFAKYSFYVIFFIILYPLKRLKF